MFRVLWVLLVSLLPSRTETQPSIPPAHCKQVCSELQLTPATAVCSIFNPRSEKAQLRFCYQGAETGKIVGCSHCCSTTKFDWLLDSGQLVRSRIASCGNSNIVLQRACEAGFNTIVSEIMATLEDKIARSQSDTPDSSSDSVVEFVVDVSGSAIEQVVEATQPYPIKGGVTTPRAEEPVAEPVPSRHADSSSSSSPPLPSQEKVNVEVHRDLEQKGHQPPPSHDVATPPTESRRLEVKPPVPQVSDTVPSPEVNANTPQEPVRAAIGEVHVSTTTNSLYLSSTQHTADVQEPEESNPQELMTPAPDSSKIISFLSRAPSGLHIRGAFQAGQSLNEFADDWCSAAGFADVREACSLVTKERITGAIKAGRWEEDIADDVSLFIPIRLRSRRLTLLTRGNETVQHAVKRMCGQLYPSSKSDEEACEQAQVPVARSLIQTHFGSRFHPSLL